MENENENIVTFEDDNGDSFELEVVDYFFYDGQEYAILADPSDLDCCCEDEECDCEDEECDCECDASDVDVYVMKVNAVDEETEEYLPVDSELEPEVLAYAERFLQGEFDEEDEDKE